MLDRCPQEIAPIDIRDSRPTVANNRFLTNAVAAITATPDSFEETNFHAPQFQSTRYTSDFARIGPEIHGNMLIDNTINGLLVRIETIAGEELRRQTVSGSWNDSDIIHVLSEVLEIQGTPGGLLDVGGNISARPDARLRIHPDLIVKLDGARIEVGIGAQLIAEGIDGQEIVFTSNQDDRFGASGSFDTSNNRSDLLAAPGDWGGIYVGHSATASIDHAVVTLGGGTSAIEGEFVGFNALEIHQADVRITNSQLINNANGVGGTSVNREGRGPNTAANIFVRGAQPIIVGNTISQSGGIGVPARDGGELVAAITINANSLNHVHLVDYGRTTGRADLFREQLGNQGPLIRNNRLDNNDVNGLVVRGRDADHRGCLGRYGRRAHAV